MLVCNHQCTNQKWLTCRNSSLSLSHQSAASVFLMQLPISPPMSDSWMNPGVQHQTCRSDLHIQCVVSLSCTNVWSYPSVSPKGHINNSKLNSITGRTTILKLFFHLTAFSTHSNPPFPLFVHAWRPPPSLSLFSATSPLLSWALHWHPRVLSCSEYPSFLTFLGRTSTSLGSPPPADYYVICKHDSP